MDSWGGDEEVRKAGRQSGLKNSLQADCLEIEITLGRERGKGEKAEEEPEVTTEVELRLGRIEVKICESL